MTNSITYFLPIPNFFSLFVQGTGSQDTLSSYEKQIQIIHYPSNGLQLSAYLRKGKIEEGKVKPAIVMLHEGNSAYSSLIKSCKPFFFLPIKKALDKVLK